MPDSDRRINLVFIILSYDRKMTESEKKMVTSTDKYLLGLRRLRRFGLRLLAYGIDPHLVLQKRRVECRVIEVVEASRHVTSLAGDRVTACRILVVLHCWM